MNIIGLDIGTTGAKAIVLDPEGKILGSAFKEYEIIYGELHKAEQDAEKIWKITCEVIKKAIRDVKKTSITAISLSVQGDAIIPIDKKFNAIHNAILGMDYRSHQQVEEFKNIFDSKEIFDLTGMRPHPLNSLSKILWFRENFPLKFKDMFKITTYEDYILAKLGGKLFIDYTMASRTMAFDIHSKKWSQYILNKLKINKNIFSEAVGSGVNVGKIKKEVADELGLSQNIHLVTGGHDQTCAALGAGVTKDGIGVISTGSAEVLSTAFFTPITNDIMFKSFYPSYCYLVEDMFFTFSLNHIGGLLLRWYRDNFSNIEISEAKRKKINSYEAMITKMPKSEPSKIMFLPHLNGSGTPFNDLHSKGAIIGLTMSTSRHDLVRAILESQSYELKINLNTLMEASIRINRLVAVGGGSKSDIWLQIKSNVLNKPIQTLKNIEAASLGSAILAGYGAGIFNSISEGVDNVVKPDKIFEPEPKISKKYQEMFSIYTKIYPAIREINRELE